MDEANRDLERELARTGDPVARLRLAHVLLRQGDPGGALALLGTAATGGALRGLEATTRAVALTRLGRPAEALEALEAAVAAGATEGLEPAPLVEALEPALAGRAIALGRARAARLLARVPERPGPLAALVLEHRSDPDPLVRLSRERERPVWDPEVDRTTRVYGSRGPDHLMGHFVTFEAPLELRLRVLDPELSAAIARALAEVSGDPDAIASFGLVAAFGEGHGLGGASRRDVDVPLLERAVARLDALDVLPFRLRYQGNRPYDVMESAKRLARRLSRDLRDYPLRRQVFDPGASVLSRLFALHPPGAKAPPRAEVGALLEEARGAFGPVGHAACVAFVKLMREAPGS